MRAPSNQFFSVRFRPDAETARAALFVASFIVAFGLLHGYVSPRFGYTLAGTLATLFYLGIFFATLSFARRRKSLAVLGITRRHWLFAVVFGFVVGGVGVLGTVNAFPAGHFAVPAWPSFLALFATAISVGFIEVLVFYGYFQFRMAEAFGPPIALLASALAWTLFHAVALGTPGAGTFGAQVLGPASFLAHLFVTFFALAVVVHLTGNIWSGLVQNALMGNVLINLYMLSVMPEHILIGDPASLPVALGVTALVIIGLMIGRRWQPNPAFEPMPCNCPDSPPLIPHRSFFGRIVSWYASVARRGSTPGRSACMGKRR